MNFIKLLPLVIVFILYVSCKEFSKQSEKELELIGGDLEEKKLNDIELISESINVNEVRQQNSIFHGEASYIPFEEDYKKTASFILNYSYTEGANRPFIEVEFSDGFHVYFNSVCEGEYSWCIRNNYNEDIGYMRLLFESNGEIANISIKRNNLSTDYEKYLTMLEGKIHRKYDALKSDDFELNEISSLEYGSNYESDYPKSKTSIGKKITSNLYENQENRLKTILQFQGSAGSDGSFGSLTLSNNASSCKYVYSYTISGSTIHAKFIGSDCGAHSNNLTLNYIERNNSISAIINGQAFVFKSIF